MTELTQGTLVASRFQLARELGRGGMGSVWLAHHVELQTPCAVKFILREAADDEEVRARFAREAKAAAQMRHPNVVQIMDYGVWDGIPYLAMEYLEGEDLGHRLRRVGRLTPLETVFVLGQAVRGLSRAHAAGIVHRDLKPDNLFLVRYEDQEVVKILDFGIAKATGGVDGSQTRTGALVGTPFYMSPEQAQGTKSIDHRADIWSLAVIAFECLAGRRPFESDALGDLLMRIMVNPLPMPSALVPSLPPELDRWWARAASRSPEHRYQTAKELHEQLAAALRISLDGSAPPSFDSVVPVARGVGVALARAPSPHFGGTTGAITRNVDPAPTPNPSDGVSGGTAAVASTTTTPRGGAKKIALGVFGVVCSLGLGAGVVSMTRTPSSPPSADSTVVATSAAPGPSGDASGEAPPLVTPSVTPIAPVASLSAAPTPPGVAKPRANGKVVVKDPKEPKAPPEVPAPPAPPKGKADMGF